MLSKLTGIQTAATRKAPIAARRAAEMVMERSIPLVPVDTGALQSSNYIEETQQNRNEASVSFGYGGPNVQINPKTGKPTSDYYHYVHEMIGRNHPTGQAKFFEQPLMESLPEIERVLGGELRQIF